MIKYVILGAVQGVTEFFPVSSSAHLVIFQKILGIGNGGLVFPVVLHLGTLLATILYFRRDILRMAFNKKQLLLTAIVTIITGLIAFPAKGLVEKMFVSPRLASLALLVTGAALILTGRLRGAVKKDVSLPDAAVMGAAQGLRCCRAYRGQGSLYPPCSSGVLTGKPVLNFLLLPEYRQ